MYLDVMRTSFLDMLVSGEGDVTFFQLYTIYFLDTLNDLMLSDATKNLVALTSELKSKFLGMELLRNFMALDSEVSMLILLLLDALFLCLNAFLINFFREPLWNHEILCLRAAYLYDFAFLSYPGKASEELNGDLVVCHEKKITK